MFNSRGHNTKDPRISYLACHNPHEHLQKDSAYYIRSVSRVISRPRKETETERRNAPFCPVSTKNCATCHMPKVELAGMHAAFTEHWIRIPKPNEPRRGEVLYTGASMAPHFPSLLVRFTRYSGQAAAPFQILLEPVWTKQNRSENNRVCHRFRTSVHPGRLFQGVVRHFLV